MFESILVLLSATLSPLTADPSYTRQLRDMGPSYNSAIAKLKGLGDQFVELIFSRTKVQREEGHFQRLEQMILEACILGEMLTAPERAGDTIKGRFLKEPWTPLNRKFAFWFCAAKGCLETENLKACSGVSLTFWFRELW